MVDTVETERQIKGLTLIELVKALRAYRRNRPLVGLSPQAEALINDRIIVNKWYPHKTLMEILGVFYRQLLASNPDNALKAGIAGGLASLQDTHRAFVKQGDPLGSLYSMRHIWPTMFDFGELEAEVVGERSVLFTLTGYPDVSEMHGMLIIGWDMAAAQLGGADDVTYSIKQRPWIGDTNMVYLINI